jgi:hypothetical protein
MRAPTSRLIIASLTFTIAVAGAGFWLASRAPDVQTLGLTPCASPPNYELVSVPCTAPDLSLFAKMPVIAYCHLIRDPVHYDNKIVRVRGIFSMGTETSVIEDPVCRSENAWTWVFSEPYSHFDDALSAADIRRGDSAEVVFLGKFSGPNDEGFGHLSGYRYQFSVMKVEEMKPLPQIAR